MTESDEEKRHLLDKIKKLRIKSSTLIHIRNANEAHQSFIDLVNSGILLDVEKFLKENSGIDINCEDYRGLTPLNIAIRNKDASMVNFLLARQGLQVRDGHLHAVEMADMNILIAILDRLRATSPDLEFGPFDGPSAAFSSNMRPIILAAIKNDVDILKLLLKRGHRLQTPHSPNCVCNDGCRSNISQNVEDCRNRLQIFGALVNPAYLCLTARDPILEMFHLHRHLIEFVKAEEFSTDYRQLQVKLSEFASHFIGLCHTTEEVEIMLKEGIGLVGTGAKQKYPRLILAIEFGQKQFVAHPNVQQVLRMAWLGDCSPFWKYSKGTRGLIIAVLIFFIPISIVLYFTTPRTRLGRMWATPLARFFGFFASYLFFMSIVLAHTSLYQVDNVHDTLHSVLIFVMIVWIVGFLFRDFMKFVIRGPKYLIATKWSLYDICTSCLFLLAFTFWGLAYFNVEETRSHHVEREYWSPLDPVLVGEGILSIASIFALGRLFCVLQLNSVLGPLQVSVQKMSMEIMKLAGLFLVIIIAFSSALSHLYWYYTDMSYVDKYGSRTYQIPAFTNFWNGMKSLFWTLFGVIPLEAVDVVLDNNTNTEIHQIRDRSHWFTQEIGYFLFGVYHVVALLLFMNMLVAAMTQRMDKVLANAEIEWKYSRAMLWLDFFDDAHVLPVPLNLLGFPWFIVKVVQRWRSEPVKTKFRFNFEYCCHAIVYEKESEEYLILLEKLIQRYLYELENPR